MARIDQETVNKILDAADIVEVVSDFVKLRRSGANYKGLCPFHDERTPSFSVNKARNICKCFSCGKGGSPVNFIMEHEQLSYQDALRYLARKYNIEIVEHELSDEERQAASDRESMFAANEFALKHFEHNLADTDEGRDIALAYFRHRGINDAMIRRFHLGYAIDRSTDLYATATAKGHREKYLVDTGLCIRSERGGAYDRFKGRVIFPIHSVSGRVVGFGGRTMRSDKTIAKYVNSPESIIYVKNRELYGLYQAKSAIAKKDRCILVEGYMDVISMHQAGVENVVASSGTSLTQGQIRAISRFSKNITVIYDADAAGIKASLRGINLLLADGMNVKVLLLPEGDDPDSFAQTHSASEVEGYLQEHEQDVIAFMSEILLRDVRPGDPVARAKAVNTILQSVSMVIDPVTRQFYTAECARTLGIGEDVILLQLNKMIAARAEETANGNRRRAAAESIADLTGPDITPQETASGTEAAAAATATETGIASAADSRLRPYEAMLTRYIVRYGLLELCDIADESGNLKPGSIVEYILSELRIDDLCITDPEYARTIEAVENMRKTTWPADLATFVAEAEALRRQEYDAGINEIRATALSISDIETREGKLLEECDAHYLERIDDFNIDYVRRRLISSPDDSIRKTATDLMLDRHALSKMFSKYTHVETEREQLHTLVPRAVYEYKAAILAGFIDDLNRQLNEAVKEGDNAKITGLISSIADYKQIQKDFAKTIGERIILPRR